MKVSILANNQHGSVEYHEYTRELVVSFPDPVIAKKVERYLTSERAYYIPESQVVEDYRQEKVIPTQSEMHMEVALCKLYSNTGVHVDWNHSQEKASCNAVIDQD